MCTSRQIRDMRGPQTEQHVQTTRVDRTSSTPVARTSNAHTSNAGRLPQHSTRERARRPASSKISESPSARKKTCCSNSPSEQRAQSERTARSPNKQHAQSERQAHAAQINGRVHRSNKQRAQPRRTTHAAWPEWTTRTVRTSRSSILILISTTTVQVQ